MSIRRGVHEPPYNVVTPQNNSPDPPAILRPAGSLALDANLLWRIHLRRIMLSSQSESVYNRSSLNALFSRESGRLPCCITPSMLINRKIAVSVGREVCAAVCYRLLNGHGPQR